MVVVFTGQRLRRIHREGQSWLARRCVSILFCYWTWQETLLQKLLEMAVKTWDRAQIWTEPGRIWTEFERIRTLRAKGFEKLCRMARKGAQGGVRKGRVEGWHGQSKVQTAKEEATKARKELEKAKSTAPVQAGAFALLCSSCSPPLLVVGSCSPLSKDPLFVKLFSPCWLPSLGSAAMHK